MSPTIGLAGAGHVGSALALALRGAGVPVVILPPRGGMPGPLAGFETADDARALAARADVVLSCLRDSDETAAMLPLLIEGARGRAAFLHIDHSNGAPAQSAAFAARWAEAGHLYADAAILGPPERLPAQKPRLIAGGSEAAIARLRGVVAPYSDEVIHAGPAGSGHRLRLIVGLMGYGIAALSAEIIATARAAGIAPAEVRAALTGKGSDSATFQTVAAAAIAPGTETRHLPIANVRRDLDRLAEAAPPGAPRDLLGAALRDFYSRADDAAGGTVMISDLAARLSGASFQPETNQ